MMFRKPALHVFTCCLPKQLSALPRGPSFGIVFRRLSSSRISLKMASTAQQEPKKESRMSEVVGIFRSIAGEPTPTGGSIRVCSESIKVTAKWTLTDVDMEKRVSYDTISVAANSDGKPEFKLIQPAKEVSESTIFTLDVDSKSQLRAVAKEVSIGDKKNEFVEVWKAETRLGTYDSEYAALHGKISMKGEMPSVQWSPDESKLLFVAEKKAPKPESYFAKKPAPESAVGDMFRWKEDWGEQLEGSVCPVIVVLDVNKMEAEVIEKEDSSLGQAIFTPDGSGIVGVERPNAPYRLGAIFCNNRLQRLFHYDFASKSFNAISAPNKCAFSPRFDNSGKTLVYLQNDVGGPHQMAAELVKIDWSSGSREPAVLLGIPANPSENEFPGLYNPSLTRRCFSEDDRTLYINSIWHSRRVILAIDLTNGTITDMTTDHEFGSWTIFDLHNGFILASRSSPSVRAHVVLGRVKSDSVEWTAVSSVAKCPNTKWKLIKMRPDGNEKQYFEAIHVFKDENRKQPLIVFPHGGPHATSVLGHTRSAQFFVECGYGVLFINYRGSLGFGEVNLRALPGAIGDVDVKDCYQAIKAVDASLVSDILLYGGSHGGFLVAHLAGQYPEAFKAAALLNPVIDMSMQGPSDIPDWYWYEAGCKGEFRHDSLATGDDLVRALAKSPIAHAPKIAAPCFFFLGTKDLRVDKGQGLRLYKHLRGRGIDAKCNMYEDNHSLGAVKHEADVSVASIEWFEKYITKP